ncbi:MAG: hypothetical protein WA839_06280 [Flavobacteriaceae bacterium]
MEHRKDIGALLKDRLDNAKKAPEQTLWERLDSSLDKREKKRRSIIWFWYGGAGILLALLLLAGALVTTNSNKLDENAPIISSEENRMKPQIEMESENPLNNTILTQEGTETKVAETIPKNSVTKTNDGSSKNPNTTGGFTVTTTHEYYNSDLDTTTTSKSKKLIDSLVATNKRVMAIKDSIARNRATDSIKLNEARKDSLRN